MVDISALVALLLTSSLHAATARQGSWLSDWRTTGKTRSALAMADVPEAQARLPPLSAGFLYPVLAWGPNNQVAGLKEALVLGRLLNRTVIVHDILNHYDDKAEDAPGHKQPFAMDFALVFDFDHLARHQSVVTLAERKAAGWDGQLDAVAHFGPKFLAQIKNAHALNVSDGDAQYLDFGHFDCTKAQLRNMASQLAAHHTVAVIVYENIVRDAGHGIKLRVTGEMCHDEYLRVSGQLTKSDKLVALATEFRSKRLGGSQQSYMAVHIRPYPDKCLFVWRRATFNPQVAKQHCKNPKLYDVFVGQTVGAMRKRGLQDLFVMSYPELRPRISEMFGREGVTPVFYDEADLEAAVGYRSTSLLGMVEEEIAFEADAFIGTSYSSMTGIIMQERYARGKMADTTATFTKTS